MYILLAQLLINSFLQGSKVRRTNYGVAMSELGGGGESKGCERGEAGPLAAGLCGWGGVWEGVGGLC